MITALLIFFPLLAGLLLLFTKGENVKKIALFVTLIELAVSLYAVVQFELNANTQFLIDNAWMDSLGINFTAGMDGISLLMVLLTTFLTPLIILSSFRHEYKNPTIFYALILFMQAGLVGVFVSLNAFLFYLFWELALIPIYFICALWGGERRIAITFKFFIYTIAGSLLMLVAFIYLYTQNPQHSMDIHSLYAMKLDKVSQGWLFWAFFVAFAIKMPIFPFHTWQPDTYTDSPTPGTMLLSGIMLKMGIYGVIRWILPMFPLGIEEWGNTAIILSVIGIVYASCIAIIQKDMKRLIAYSSIAHVGLIAAGIFAINSQGLQGGVIQMLSHGINVVGLFFIIDIIYDRTKTRTISELGGIAHSAPFLAICFMIVMLGAVALPLTNGFIGEFLLLMGLYQYNAWLAAIAGLTIILGAVYMLNTYQAVMLGESKPATTGFKDLYLSEKAVLIPIIIMIIWIGIYPKPFLQIAQPAIEQILTNIKK